MKTWNGLPLYVCSVCGYSTVNPASFTEHERISGHKEPDKSVDPVEGRAEEAVEWKPVSKKRKSKADETAELETTSEVNND